MVSLGRRFAAALLPRLFGTNPMSHHKGGFEPETNGFQFYAIANLDKTSLIWSDEADHILLSLFVTSTGWLVLHILV